MRRRDLVLGLASALALPRAANAQKPERRRLVGVAMSTAESEPHEQAAVKAFVDEMARLGWEPGRNLDIVYRWGTGDAKRMTANAHQLAALRPDAILAKGGAMPALRGATATIPIVFVVTSDAAALSYAGEFAHPRGNMTGFTTPEDDLIGKRLQLLREIAPGISRVLYLWSHDVGGPASRALLARIAIDATSYGIDLVDGLAEAPADINRVIGGFVRGVGDGLVVAFSAVTTTHRRQIVDLAARFRLPAVYPMDFFVESGGLLSYGFDQAEMFRQGAGYIDRILRGAKPADLPVQLPTRFDFVINLRTARMLGLKIPPSVQIRADRIIE